VLTVVMPYREQAGTPRNAPGYKLRGAGLNFAMGEIDHRHPPLLGQSLSYVVFLDKAKPHKPFAEAALACLLLHLEGRLELVPGEAVVEEKNGAKLRARHPTSPMCLQQFPFLPDDLFDLRQEA
jgi:hypothetical protein